MTCTLDIYTDYLISSTGQSSATGLSRLYDGALSHDPVRGLLTNSYLDSKDLWSTSKPLIGAAGQSKSADEFAVLIVQDSILEKAHTDVNAMLTTHWDHGKQRFVNGLNFVSLLYQLGNLSLPIAATLIEKTLPEWDAKSQKHQFKSEFTKNEHLQQMLSVAQQQVQYRYVLADSWYASADNMNYVLGLKHHFIFALESSRTVARSESARSQGQFQPLDALTFPDKGCLTVYLRSVKQAVWVGKQLFTNKDASRGTFYLVSSDTSLDYEQMTTIYKRSGRLLPWKIEEYHKSLKQNTSMGASPTKTPHTQANHFFASMRAYIKLEALQLKSDIGLFRLQAQHYLVALKASNQELNRMAA
jgi:hypothetical protein